MLIPLHGPILENYSDKATYINKDGYFKEIELLEVGDEVTITNIWGTLTYVVTEIKIINPNDVNAILIQKDRDMITLLTCHPYASGGKYRYLVFCERVEDAK